MQALQQLLTKDPRKESGHFSEHAFVGLLIDDWRQSRQCHGGIRKGNLAAGKRQIYRRRRRSALSGKYKGRFEIGGGFSSNGRARRLFIRQPGLPPSSASLLRLRA